MSFLRSSGSTLEALHRDVTASEEEEAVRLSVGGDGASAQAAARQALEDAHGDVHEGPKVEEQVVEGVDGQAARLVGVLERHDGRVQAVGQVPEARAAGLNHFLNALKRQGEEDSVGVDVTRSPECVNRVLRTLAMSSGVCPMASKTSMDDGR